MSMQASTYDLIVGKCEGSHQLRLDQTLLRTQTPIPQVQQIHDRISEQKNDLFDEGAKNFMIVMWECYTGESSCEQKNISGLKQLKDHLSQHLTRREKDPLLRHVFLSAAHSYSPLQCTSDSFLYLCVYHQISPQFIDLLFSFGVKRENQRDFHQPRCYQEYWPKGPAADFAAPELGRSGWETRMCCKLSAMELSTWNNEWTNREMAFYHSFDLTNGRSLFVTVKANSRIRDEIISSDSAAPKDIASSFTASLNTLLVCFNWCVEGWTRHISDIERQILKETRKLARRLPEADPSFGQELRKVLETPISSSTQPSPKTEHARLPPSPNSSQKVQESAKGSGDHLRPDGEGVDLPLVEDTMKTFKIQEELPITIVQTLTFRATKLREAKLIMALDEGVLREQRRNYHNLVRSAEFPKEVKKRCAVDFETFEKRIKQLESLLRKECLRADTLLQVVGDAKDLYDFVKQSQNSRINMHLAMSAHGAAARAETSARNMEEMTEGMHDIAHKTERDTASMHIITFITLLFLPGTFLGSLFSAPIFDESDPGEWRSPSPNRGMLLLFLVICIPMTLVIIVLWMMYMRWTGAKKGRREEGIDHRCQKRRRCSKCLEKGTLRT